MAAYMQSSIMYVSLLLKSRYMLYSVKCRDQGTVIRHGILPTYSYRLSGSILSLLFQPASQESVVLSGHTCTTYTRGKRKEKYSLGVEGDGEGGRRRKGDGGESLFKLLYTPDYNAYVGVCKNAIKV